MKREINIKDVSDALQSGNELLISQGYLSIVRLVLSGKEIRPFMNLQSFDTEKFYFWWVKKFFASKNPDWNSFWRMFNEIGSCQGVPYGLLVTMLAAMPKGEEKNRATLGECLQHCLAGELEDPQIASREIIYIALETSVQGYWGIWKTLNDIGCEFPLFNVRVSDSFFKIINNPKCPQTARKQILKFLVRWSNFHYMDYALPILKMLFRNPQEYEADKILAIAQILKTLMEKMKRINQFGAVPLDVDMPYTNCIRYIIRQAETLDPVSRSRLAVCLARGYQYGAIQLINSFSSTKWEVLLALQKPILDIFKGHDWESINPIVAWDEKTGVIWDLCRFFNNGGQDSLGVNYHLYSAELKEICRIYVCSVSRLVGCYAVKRYCAELLINQLVYTPDAELDLVVINRNFDKLLDSGLVYSWGDRTGFSEFMYYICNLAKKVAEICPSRKKDVRSMIEKLLRALILTASYTDDDGCFIFGEYDILKLKKAAEVWQLEGQLDDFLSQRQEKRQSLWAAAKEKKRQEQKLLQKLQEFLG